MHKTDAEVMQDDMQTLMGALGLPVHARPESPHDVMVNEVIPAAKRLRSQSGASERTVVASGVADLKAPSGEPWCAAINLYDDGTYFVFGRAYREGEKA